MPFHAAQFVTLDRQDDSSRVGVEISRVFPPDRGYTVEPWRFDAHGQWIDLASGIGGYVSVPVSHASGSEYSGTGLGDIEVGGIVVRPWHAALVTFHGGITLPTLTDPDARAAALDAAAGRLTDYVQTIPEGVSLRLGVSPTVRHGRLFARADVGVDVNVSAATDHDDFVRANAGVGVSLGMAAVMLESTNLRLVGDGGGWSNTAALAVRFEARHILPYVGLVVALDDDARRNANEALTVGIEANLP